MRTRGGSLAPGGVVGDGRYRLLAQFGVDERTGAHLWRARDGQQRRDVALTLLVGNPGDTEEFRRGTRTLERAAHIGKFNHPGLAQVLDILSLGNGINATEGLLGVVVAQWTKGADLIDLVADQPVDPAVAARMVQALAESVEQAHQSGLVLGIDHPQRLRLTPAGNLRLAFPGPPPNATLRDDVKALGAVLYLLLTGRWALEGGPPALPAAPRSPNGRIVPPRSLVPGVPQELSELAVRTVEDGGHGAIRTSAAILHTLDRIATETEARSQQPAQEGSATNVDADGTVWMTKKPVRDAKRRRKLALGVTVLVVAAVGVLAWLGMLAISFFQDDTDVTGPPINLASSAHEPPPPEDRNTPPVLGDPVTPSTVDVYNPEGGGDGVAEAAHVIDGDAATVWRTNQYQQQFPESKSGVGLLASFDNPVNLAELRVVAGSPGTSIQVRVADDGNPEFEDTRVVASGDIDDGETTLTLQEPVATEHVLIWLTALSGSEPQFASQIGELTFLPAAG